MLSKIPGLHPGAAIRQFGIVRSEPTEEYHAAQLKEKPNDPQRLSNYAVFLMDVAANFQKAEAVLERSLRIDSKHVLSRLNLGVLKEKQSNFKQARLEYETGIKFEPTNEMLNWNLSCILEHQFGDIEAALAAAERGFKGNPSSIRSAIRRMYLATKLKHLDRLEQAISDAESVAGVEQTEIFHARALLLHWRQAPLGDRIAAWQAAAALRPNEAGFKINLAQLLYLRGDNTAASALLAAALRLGLSASEEAEAQVYRICHSDAPPRSIAADIRRVLEKGGRLDWDVQANVDSVKRKNPTRGEVAEVFVGVLAGARDIGELDSACTIYDVKNR